MGMQVLLVMGRSKKAQKAHCVALKNFKFSFSRST